MRRLIRTYVIEHANGRKLPPWLYYALFDREYFSLAVDADRQARQRIAGGDDRA